MKRGTAGSSLDWQCPPKVPAISERYMKHNSLVPCSLGYLPLLISFVVIVGLEVSLFVPSVRSASLFKIIVGTHEYKFSSRQLSSILYSTGPLEIPSKTAVSGEVEHFLIYFLTPDRSDSFL